MAVVKRIIHAVCVGIVVLFFIAVALAVLGWCMHWLSMARSFL